MLFSGYDLIDWGVARVTDYVNFLRSIPSFFAPKPSPQSIPYTPPFTGGQCLVQYTITYDLFNPDNSPWQSNKQIILNGAFIGTKYIPNSAGNPNEGIYFISQSGTAKNFITNNPDVKVVIKSVVRVDGSTVECGNLPNPNPAPNINDDGLFAPTNPVIGDENGTLNPAAIVLSPAFPLALVGAILAGYAAALAAANIAADALAAIKKVAEALDSLKKLWEKLQEFLEEWEKDRPKNREIVRQTYGNINGDGAIDFYPLNNKNFVGIQVDIVVTEVPIGFGKYFGSMSPSRYRYKELGYISFYSISKGIVETHSIQFKRTSLIIPKTAVGFIYHFGLDDKIKGFAFGTFSVRKT